MKHEKKICVICEECKTPIAIHDPSELGYDRILCSTCYDWQMKIVNF